MHQYALQPFWFIISKDISNLIFCQTSVQYDSIQFKSVKVCFVFPPSQLGAVHKLRHPIRGYGGLDQKMTKDDRGVGGSMAKDDG